jgi:hypothetical protein
MTVHRDYATKACPGEWLYSRHGQIAEEVNKRLEETDDEDMTPERLAEMLPEAFALLAKKEAAPWAKEALDYCKEKGYMVGDGNGNQQPMKPCSAGGRTDHYEHRRGQTVKVYPSIAWRQININREQATKRHLAGASFLYILRPVYRLSHKVCRIDEPATLL